MFKILKQSATELHEQEEFNLTWISNTGKLIRYDLNVPFTYNCFRNAVMAISLIRVVCLKIFCFIR